MTLLHSIALIVGIHVKYSAGGEAQMILFYIFIFALPGFLLLGGFGLLLGVFAGIIVGQVEKLRKEVASLKQDNEKMRRILANRKNE
ncbi:hypothetical protein FLK61_37280 [Paenalkalicoccus suaedae]|uniref:Uncharacterized protein n=2 Tax=Paenalkalicoccus suaedae TaxID=2592382 RepID=A0A859FHL1_9BACI|nr:hypothetical protein FLK61_37280 [Paenalkalicoccus suaedae]